MTKRSYKFTVPGKPKVKGRPRFARGRTYTPKSTLEGPISISCVFTSKRTQVTISELDESDTKLRGDTTNYLKAVEDALNGVAYDDDIMVYRIVGRKK
jgi:Holliday junction resolvase RusA-like endonuclease